MFCNNNNALWGIAGLLVLCGAIFSTEVSSQELQKIPITLKASDILSQKLLKGPNYTINETVKSDGFINTYELETRYGPVRVQSTTFLLKRINELLALERMKQLEKTDAFARAAQEAATGPLSTAKDLVVDPIGTAKDIASGIARFIGNIGQAVASDNAHQPNVVKAALGQASNKRAFAYEFGVDPYSSYKPLQDNLDKIAWTATAGSLTVKAAFSAIPGGAGAAVSVTSTSQSLRSLIRDNTPAALTEINRQKLSGMGVPGPVAKVFLNNRYYGPFEQTLLVGELENMPAVKNRGSFVTVAAEATDETVAVFMRATAQFTALYNKSIKPVQSFVEAGGLAFLKTKDGTIVGIFPIDNVAWTDSLARREKELSQAIRKMGAVKGKELWFGGPVDPAARQALETKGWKVVDRFSERFFKEPAGKAVVR